MFPGRDAEIFGSSAEFVAIGTSISSREDAKNAKKTNDQIQ